MPACRKSFVLSAFTAGSALLIYTINVYTTNFADNVTSVYKIHREHDKPHVVYVRSNGTLVQRIRQFNDYISSFRVVELEAMRKNNMSWQPIIQPVTAISGTHENLFHKLWNCCAVITIVLPWQYMDNWTSLMDTSNLRVQEYFEWTADDRLCNWIETPGAIKMKYGVYYNWTCNRNINDTAKPRSLKPIMLNIKIMQRSFFWPNEAKLYPQHYFVNQPSIVTHIHIFRDALVTKIGEVFSGRFKLSPYGCKANMNTALPDNGKNLNKIQLHDEVFVISHYWGTSVFHRMVEIVPRLTLYLDFLRVNVDIRIQAPEGKGGRLGQLVTIMGLNESRLVAEIVRARRVYVPPATQCGVANVAESQTLAKIYHEYIRDNFTPQPRNRLVLIRRSHSRRFTRQAAIEEVVRRAAADYSLNFTLFADNPTPSLNDTMQIFYSAAVVVGPHGAGLANILFSLPGTFVVEGVCNLPHVNLCFQRLVHVLGHHWHGIASRRGCEGVVDIAEDAIDAALRQYLALTRAH